MMVRTTLIYSEVNKDIANILVLECMNCDACCSGAAGDDSFASTATC